MPKKTKTKTTIRKNKNKNKVVVRNVININSNNKKTKPTRPTFQQMTQQRPSNPVITHFIQQPTSHFNPDFHTSLTKVNSNVENLINRFNERDAQIQRELGRRNLSDEFEAVYNNDSTPRSRASSRNSVEEIIERGPTSTTRTPQDEPSRSLIQSIFGGRRQGVSAPPLSTNSLSPNVPRTPTTTPTTPFTRAGTTEAEVRQALIEIDNDDPSNQEARNRHRQLRGIFTSVVGTAPPPALTRDQMISRLVNDFRDRTALQLSTIKDVRGRDQRR